jgi:hypothetical protein
MKFCMGNEIFTKIKKKYSAIEKPLEKKSNKGCWLKFHCKEIPNWANYLLG